jgi:hypothetical protein
VSRVLPALVIVVVSFCVFWPGVNGPFVFDDYHNIVNNPDVHATSLSVEQLAIAALAGKAGPLKRPIPMLSFGVNYYYSQLFPLSYKLTNLAIHTLNGVLVYAIVLLLLSVFSATATRPLQSRRLVALAIALVWTLHPINVSSVLYVVQRMTSLAALFMFAGVLIYLYARVRMRRGESGLAMIWIGSLSCVVLAALSKENGVLLLPMLFMCELLLFRFQTAVASERINLLVFFLVTVVIPSVATIAFVVSEPWLGELYAQRQYTLVERLLTQTRVLWFYVGMLLTPSTATLGIFHDSMVMSSDLLAPPTTLASMLGILALLGAAIAAHRRAPIFTFGVLWFFIGHVVESTILPLEMVHEHRNYFPGVGVIFVAVYYLLLPNYTELTQKCLRTGVVVLVVILAFSTYTRAQQWRDPIELAFMEAEHHPDSHRTRYELGRVLHLVYQTTGDPAQLSEAREEFQAALSLSEIRQLPLFSWLQIDLMEGLEPSAEKRALLSARLREHPFDQTVPGGLYSLIQCGVQMSCELPPDLMLELFGAALQNPSYSTAAKNEVLVLLATYYINVAGDLEAAERVYAEIVETAPNDPLVRLRHARVLLLMDRVSEAMTRLNEVEQRLSARDKMFGYSALFREFEQTKRDAYSR